MTKIKGTPVNQLKTFVVGMIETNCYLLYDVSSRIASVIDPGDDAAGILVFLAKNGLTLKDIFISHGHGDHIGGVAELKQSTGAAIWVHRDDADELDSPDRNLSYSIGGGRIRASRAERMLENGMTVTLGSMPYTVIHTPGHTSGGICFFGEGRLFSGDTLFMEGVGRSDLFGGDGELLIRMIKERLFILPEETKVFPGHGPSTSIGWEKRNNPFN